MDLFRAETVLVSDRGRPSSQRPMVTRSSQVPGRTNRMEPTSLASSRLARWFCVWLSFESEVVDANARRVRRACEHSLRR